MEIWAPQEVKLWKYDRVIVLDRDNTLIQDQGQTCNRDSILFYPNALKLLDYLFARRFGVAIATNQSAVGRGLFSSAELREFHNHMNTIIRKRTGHSFLYIISCTHADLDKCECRKPRSLMLHTIEQLSGKRPIAFIGDASSDVECAIDFDIKAIQVNQWNIYDKVTDWISSIDSY